MAKKSAGGGVILLIIALFAIRPVWGFIKAHWLGLTISLGLIVFALIFNKFAQAKSELNDDNERLATLRKKYKKEDVVQSILNGEFWEKQTEEQLQDSLGEPESIDEQKTKAKRTEIWKYGHKHGNQYRLRITLVNGKVTGWEQKS
jgi:hypothetical protein